MAKFLITSLLLPLLISADIVINEVHYDSEPNYRRNSFVELHNSGTNTVDLSGWHFSDGIDFMFDVGVTLAAGEYLVVVENTNTFTESLPGEVSQVDLADLVGWRRR